MELIICGESCSETWRMCQASQAGWCDHLPTTTGSSLIHHGLQKSCKDQNMVILKDYQKEKQLILTPLLGLASSDWLGQSQPLWRQKYTPLTAAFEPNPQLV